MDSSRAQSFFQNLRSRELNGFRVRKRPYIEDLALDFSEFGAMAVQHNGEQTPPMAVSFCKTSKNSHIFAVSVEGGHVSLFDSRRNFSTGATYQENAEKSKISAWAAHHNAIFDLCWIKEDNSILTASGDQNIKLWDVQENKCTGVLMGHTGSVKSLSSHPTNSDLIVSGSRDGSFAIWDLRCKIGSKCRLGEHYYNSAALVKGAHASPQAKWTRRAKAASMSITSVLYLKDEVSIATAGAVDGIVKFWDSRNLKAQVTQVCPRPKSSTEKEERLHGITSLSQDLNGVFLAASSMNNRIYLYNVLQLEKGPIKSFSGCRIETFFVKSAISPDAAHILSGSSDGNAYIWQVNKPQLDPVTLESHDGEVTAVDWCSSEVGKLATVADDFTVRIWNTQSSQPLGQRSPSSIRRRVMAIPSTQRRKLMMDEEPMGIAKGSPSSHHFDEKMNNGKSSNHLSLPVVRTPEAREKKIVSNFDSEENFQKTPEVAMKSPSSVLNPPSSLKRKTIRDYFLVAP